MSLPDTQPNWFDSSETGAPTLNNATGSMVTLLKSVLVTGFNVKAVSQIVVASGVATVTAASHGFSDSFGKLIQVSGAAVPALNGNHQPEAVTTNTFAYAATGVADGTYTGSIEARRAPLGWEVAFEDVAGTVAIFRRTAPESTAMMLRVSDNGASATNARAVMIESATDVETYGGVSPPAANVSGGLYWYKGANSATAKQWALAGNDRFAWFIHPAASGTAPYATQASYFGDLFPYVTPAPYDCVLCGSFAADATSGLQGGTVNSGYNAVTLDYGQVISRGLDGVSIGARVGKLAPGPSWIGATNQGHTSTVAVPIAAPVHVAENDFGTASGRLRGEIPGLAVPLGRAPFSASGQFAIINPAQGAQRKYLSVLYTIGSGQNGNLLLDLSGPWY